MMLTIISFGDGKCVWCCQTTEGVQAKFQDGLSGFLCRKDFWAAVKARSEGDAAQPPDGAARRKD
jgi:hypothetical protein